MYFGDRGTMINMETDINSVNLCLQSDLRLSFVSLSHSPLEE